MNPDSGVQMNAEAAVLEPSSPPPLPTKPASSCIYLLYLLSLQATKTVFLSTGLELWLHKYSTSIIMFRNL